MKKLMIISHPELAQSKVQSFLLEGLREFGVEIEIIKLDELVNQPDLSEVDWEYQQKLVLESDEIYLQFPLYWYSAPASLSLWQEKVFTNRFMSQVINRNADKQGQLRLVVSLSEKLSDLGAGNRISRTLSELLSPYQAFAERLEFSYKAPFIIDQFMYKTEKEQQLLLIDYLMTVTAENQLDFVRKGKWLLQQIKKIQPPTQIDILADFLSTQIAEYETLDATLAQIKYEEDE